MASSQPATATCSSVISANADTALLAANSARQGAYVWNESSAVLYLKFGTGASASSYTVQLAAGGYYELPSPVYQGAVNGFWASANGNARVTETV